MDFFFKKFRQIYAHEAPIFHFSVDLKYFYLEEVQWSYNQHVIPFPEFHCKAQAPGNKFYMSQNRSVTAKCNMKFQNVVHRSLFNENKIYNSRDVMLQFANLRNSASLGDI